MSLVYRNWKLRRAARKVRELVTQKVLASMQETKDSTSSLKGQSFTHTIYRNGKAVNYNSLRERIRRFF